MENVETAPKTIPIEIRVQAFELLVLIITIVSVFLWCRSDAKDDYRRTEALIDAIRQEVNSEMKDFHGRLCAIEERNRGGEG
jgi:hypothetical protein